MYNTCITHVYTYFCRCAGIVSKFMSLDLDKDDVTGFLRDYVLPTAQDIL